MPGEYRPRVERAISFILANLDKPLSVETVSRAANLSQFYFHRVFTALTGEPVGRFVTRSRLHVAALRLAYEPDRDVTDIALSSGYSSPSNFTKAFTGFYGCSPSELRSPRSNEPLARGRLKGEYGQSLRLKDLYGPGQHDSDGTTRTIDVHAEVRFVDTRKIPLCCMAAPRGARDLVHTWRLLHERAFELGMDVSPAEGFVIVFDHTLLTAPQLHRFHVCVPSWEGFVPPAPLFMSFVPAGRYAVFRIVGTPQEVKAQYDQVYARWPVGRDVMIENLWPIEHHHRVAPAGQRDFDLWIKVRPRR